MIEDRTQTWKNRTLFLASFPLSTAFIVSCSSAASPHFGRYIAPTSWSRCAINYTVEVVGFEDSIREVALRAVRATFQKIGSKRLGSYLDLEGSELDEYIAKLGWRFDTGTGVIELPQNPDNQIASTVVQEDIKLPQLTKVISHAISAV